LPVILPTASFTLSMVIVVEGGVLVGVVGERVWMSWAFLYN
jgi:hypothetical protein